MNPVAILTDSTSYLPEAVRKQYRITVIPLSLIWEEETYADGVDITPEEFYNRLESSASLPSTSQPSVAAFETAFQDLLDRGKDILAILISSGISGTVHSAQQAKKLLDTDRIRVVDSKTAGMAAGLHIIAAARAAEAGESLAACAETALNAQQQTNVVFAVDTLEYLHKGGRIGGAKRFLGSMLNIKPILEMRDGRIEPVDQVRTHKRALDRMIELTRDRSAEEQPLRMAIMHSNVPDQAKQLQETVEQLFSPEEIFLSELSPVIGTHVGPGTLAIACMHGM
jgi:DegV family protein with EDD domain